MEETVKKSIEIFDAKISFMSLVDKPANLRPFLITKAESGEDGNTAFQGYGRILKVDADTHYVTGVAYEPMVEDAHGNFMTEEEIQKMAYWFAKNGDKVDLQHSFEALDSACVVETWVTKSDCVIGEEEVKKGTWLVTVEITDDQVWKAVENGEITGFSIGGIGKYGEEDIDLTKEGDELEKSQKSTVAKSDATEVAQASESVHEDAKGLLVKFGNLFGFEMVEKGAVADEFNRRQKASAFWNAINSFTGFMIDEHWDYRRDCWVADIENDPEKINEAIADLREALEAVLLDNNLVKCLTAAAPIVPSDDEAISKSADALMLYVEKAGKKMSAANKKRLQEISQSLSEFAKEFEEETEETKEDDDDMKKEDIQKMIDEAIEKAAKPAAAPDDEVVQKTAEPAGQKPEEVTEEDVQKMIQDAVKKAMENDPAPEKQPAAAPLTKGVVEAMINKAMEDLKASRGFATNINEETAVQKSGNDQHYLHGVI